MGDQIPDPSICVARIPPEFICPICNQVIQGCVKILKGCERRACLRCVRDMFQFNNPDPKYRHGGKYLCYICNDRHTYQHLDATQVYQVDNEMDRLIEEIIGKFPCRRCGDEIRPTIFSNHIHFSCKGSLRYEEKKFDCDGNCTYVDRQCKADREMPTKKTEALLQKKKYKCKICCALVENFEEHLQRLHFKEYTQMLLGD